MKKPLATAKQARQKYPKGILKDILKNTPKKSSYFKYVVFVLCKYLFSIKRYFKYVYFDLRKKLKKLFKYLIKRFTKYYNLISNFFKQTPNAFKDFLNKQITFLNNKANKEVLLFNTNFSFKPFLILQGAAVFIAVLFSLVFSLNLLFPKPEMQISQQSIIKTAAIKQTSAAIANQPSFASSFAKGYGWTKKGFGEAMPVKWTMVIKRNAISSSKEGQYLALLPKNAANIKVKTISANQAKTILAKQTPNPKTQLTLEDRKVLAYSQSPWLAGFLSSDLIFSKISLLTKYLFAGLEEAASQVIEQVADQFTDANTDTNTDTEKPLTPEVIKTEESAFVDLSEMAVETPIETPATEQLSQEEQLENSDKSKEEDEKAKDEQKEDKEEKPAKTSEEDSGGPATISPPARHDGETSGEEASLGGDKPTEIPIETPIETPADNITETPETISPSDLPVITSDDLDYVQINFETPAPTITEQETNTGKLVTVSSGDTEKVDCELLNPVKRGTVNSSTVLSPAGLFNGFKNIIASTTKFFTADLEQVASQVVETITNAITGATPEIIQTTDQNTQSQAPVDETKDKKDKQEKEKEATKEEKKEAEAEVSATPDLTPTSVTEPVEEITPAEETPATQPATEQVQEQEAPAVESPSSLNPTPSTLNPEQQYQDCLAQQTPVTNVLAHTTIPEIYKVGEESKIKIKWLTGPASPEK